MKVNLIKRHSVSVFFLSHLVKVIRHEKKYRNMITNPLYTFTRYYKVPVPNPPITEILKHSSGNTRKCGQKMRMKEVMIIPVCRNM